MTLSTPITTFSVWGRVPPRPDLSTELILHVESNETVRTARDLAELLGTSVEEAVAFALRAQLRRERAMQPSAEQRLRAIHEFVAELAELPLADEHEPTPAHASHDDATPS